MAWAALILGAGLNAQRPDNRQRPSALWTPHNGEQSAPVSSVPPVVSPLKFGQREAAEPAATSPSSPHDRPPTPLAAVADPLVNNPAMDLTAADAQGVTSIVLGSGSNVIVAFEDTGSGVGGANRLTGFSRSTNGGTTWTDGGVLPGNNDRGHPVLTRDTTTGRLYLSTGWGMQMFRSDDDGTTWLPSVSATGNVSVGIVSAPWHAVDNFPGPGQGNVYAVFRDWFGLPLSPTRINLTRSTDGGATFPSSGHVEIISASGWMQAPRVVVGPDHSVYVFWFDVVAYPQFGIRMRRSTDRGATFGPPVTVISLQTGGPGLEFPANSYIQAAVNPVSGHLYAVYNDDGAGTDRADVFLTISTDLGTTWSTPVRVSSDTTTNDQFFPTLAITPDGSKLFAAWYDRRSDPGNSRVERWGRIGAIAGGTVTFGADFAISSGSFPVDATYVGNYDQAVADNDFFYTTWSDTRLPNPHVPARTNQQDVRFAKIPAAGPGAILMLDTAAPATLNPAACNDVSVSIRNNGTAIATGISATLTTTTPNVSVDAASSAYPDISVGSAATNAQPFRIRFNSGFPCGQTVSFSLAVTTATEGSFAIPFQVTTPPALGTPLNVDNNTPLPIPDFSSVESAIAVSGFSGNVGKVTASFYLAHTSDVDLRISLIGPDNTTVDLTSSNGLGGTNYGSACTPLTSRTTFDDAAATSITAGSPPFVGSFRPEQALVAFDGKTGPAVNGTWRLRIVDDYVGGTGTLVCWSLTVIPTGICTAGGNCGLPPTTTADTYTTAFNTALSVAAPGVLSNDSANGGGATAAALVSNVTHGTLLLDSSGGVTYTPNAGFVGNDTFTYRATNSNGPGNVAVVTITVNPPPTPTSVADAYGTAFNTTLTVAAPGVLGNDTNIGGSSIMAALVSDPANGVVSLSASGGFTYTPNACFVGTDSFSYRATNAGGAGNIATVTIAVADATSIQPPRNLVASSVVGNSVTLRFDPPCGGPAATRFTLKGGLNPGETLAAVATGSPYAVYSFTAPSGAFYVRMHAADGAAESAASNEIRLFVNVPQPPSAPTSLTGLANGSTIELHWQNTFAGGTPASTLLDVTGSATTTITLGPGESFSAPGVPPGTYTLQVRSSNGTGVSGPSNSVTMSFPSACSGAPQAPERFLAYRLGNTLFVSWDAPSTGPAPTEYLLRATGAAVGTFTIPGRLAFATVGPGTYNLSVLARNVCGSSPETPSQMVTIP